jgi:hypothetical protein
VLQSRLSPQTRTRFAIRASFPSDKLVAGAIGPARFLLLVVKNSFQAPAEGSKTIALSLPFHALTLGMAQRPSDGTMVQPPKGGK